MLHHIGEQRLICTGVEGPHFPLVHLSLHFTALAQANVLLRLISTSGFSFSRTQLTLHHELKFVLEFELYYSHPGNIQSLLEALCSDYQFK